MFSKRLAIADKGIDDTAQSGFLALDFVHI